MGLDSFPYWIFGRKERFLLFDRNDNRELSVACHFEEANATEKSFRHES